MEEQFTHIVDLTGEDKVFPNDKRYYALFFTEDKRFFIYALYTKEDLSSAELIEVDFDSYMNLRSPEVVENVVDNIDHLANILFKMKRDTLFENVSVGQVLNLDDIK